MRREKRAEIGATKIASEPEGKSKGKVSTSGGRIGRQLKEAVRKTALPPLGLPQGDNWGWLSSADSYDHSPLRNDSSCSVDDHSVLY